MAGGDAAVDHNAIAIAETGDALGIANGGITATTQQDVAATAIDAAEGLHPDGAASTGADDELDIFLRFLLRMSGPDAVGKQ